MCRHSAGEMGEARGRDRRWTTESSETKTKPTNQRGGSQPGESEWVSMVSRSQVLSEWCGSLRSDARAATASGVTVSPDPSVVNGKGKLGLKETRIMEKDDEEKKTICWRLRIIMHARTLTFRRLVLARKWSSQDFWIHQIRDENWTARIRVDR